MSVRARITRVARPAMGEGVGYGFSYRVPRTRVQICTLPIGYADGLSRTLSNRMDVLYKGERVHQVGNICMDFCFALADKNVKAGDEVVFFGRQGDGILTAEDMADACGTISYEILTGVKRYERVYINRDGKIKQEI